MSRRFQPAKGGFCNRAKLGVRSESTSLSHLNELFKCSQTEGFNIGDKFTTRSGTYVRGESVWSVSSEDQWQTDSIEDHVKWICEKFTPYENQLQILAKEPGTTVFGSIDLMINDPVGGFSVSALAVQQFARLVQRVDVRAWVTNPPTQ